MDGVHNCPVCERDVTRVSDHHLIPRSRGGKHEHTLPICNDCHNAIHALLTNVELEREFNSVASLLEDERFAKHVRWLRKQSPDRRMRTRTARDKRKKRRR